MSVKEEKKGLRSFFRTIFFGGSKDGSSDGKKNSTKSNVKQVDFGIDKTETLTHFSKPKPPANRRRPRSSVHPGKPMMDTKPEPSENEPILLNGNSNNEVKAEEKKKSITPPKPLAQLLEEQRKMNEKQEQRDEDCQEKDDQCQSKSVPNLADEQDNGIDQKRISVELKAGRKISPPIMQRSKCETEEKVQIRSKCFVGKRHPYMRSTSLGESQEARDSYGNYRDLILAAHKSTPPLAESVN